MLPTLFYHPCPPPEDCFRHCDDDYYDDVYNNNDHDDHDGDDEDDDEDDRTWSLPLVQMYISLPTSPGTAKHYFHLFTTIFTFLQSL